MSLFQRIHQEKNELIHFEALISEIAEQENISFSEACAVIAREVAEHSHDISFGFYAPFYLYKYDAVDGFIRDENFSIQSLIFLRSMAKGDEYEEESGHEQKGFYRRIDGGHGWNEG